MDLTLSVSGPIVTVLPVGSFSGKTLRNQDSMYVQRDIETGDETVRAHLADPYHMTGGWALTCSIRGRTPRIHILSWDKRKSQFVHRLHYALFRDGIYRVTPRRVHPIEVVSSSRRRKANVRQNQGRRAPRGLFL